MWIIYNPADGAIYGCEEKLEIAKSSLQHKQEGRTFKLELANAAELTFVVVQRKRWYIGGQKVRASGQLEYNKEKVKTLVGGRPFSGYPTNLSDAHYLRVGV